MMSGQHSLSEQIQCISLTTDSMPSLSGTVLDGGLNTILSKHTVFLPIPVLFVCLLMVVESHV